MSWSNAHSCYKSTNANDFCLALLVFSSLFVTHKGEHFTLMWVTCCHAMQGNAAVRAAINQSDQEKPARWFSACCLTWLSGSLSVCRITQPNSPTMMYCWAAHEIRWNTYWTVGLFQEETYCSFLRGVWPTLNLIQMFICIFWRSL